MPATLKMMHAIKADLEDRLILAPMSTAEHRFLLKNPSITVAEIRALSARQRSHAAHPDDSREPRLERRRAGTSEFARNPRLPDMFVESLLESLPVHELKNRRRQRDDHREDEAYCAPDLQLRGH